MEKVNDNILVIANYIMDILKHDHDKKNIHYIARLELLNNYKYEDYTSKIEKRTGVDKESLRKDAIEYIKNLKQNIISLLASYNNLELISIFNNETRMNRLLDHINERIGEVEHDVFLQKCD